ncbi:ATPase AAA [Salinisphaera shabanensis T35B1]|uniref:hypothetical protein n=1 Tax=Salinisphaera TaxID=180541 RepID=UPI0033420030
MSNAKSLIRQTSRQLRSLVLDHHRQTDVIEELRTFMTFGEPGRVFLVVGPGGVGKASTMRALRRSLLKDCAVDDLYHAVRVDAHPPANGTFNWKSFWKTGLLTLHDPLAGQRRRASENPGLVTEFVRNSRYRGEPDYRADFSNALVQRNVRHLLITHGEDMLQRGRPGAAVEQLRTLAALLRNEANRPSFIVVSGTYELLQMCRRDPALDRMTHVVHMGPYDATNSFDQQEFVRILKSYEDALEQCPAGVLTENPGPLFQASSGCIGWIKQVLSDSVCWMAKRGGHSLTWADIEAAFKDRRVLANLREQIERGERALPKHNAGRSSEPVHQVARKRSQNRRVGERNPARDRVGPED